MIFRMYGKLSFSVTSQNGSYTQYLLSLNPAFGIITQVVGVARGAMYLASYSWSTKVEFILCIYLYICKTGTTVTVYVTTTESSASAQVSSTAQR